VKKVDTLKYGIRITAFAMFLAASLQTGGAHQFSTKVADCVTLECAAAVPTSHSFDPPGNSQESSSNTTPRPATKSEYVREGRWRKLPGNFVHDQKDMWLTFPQRLA
jgi:hypothetical protein